jgi:hypothetical protein
MRKIFGCFLAGCALIASSVSTFAFEAVLANNFALYSHPYSHERMMTLVRVDEFDQAQACGETDDGSEIPGRLFAA